MSVILILFLLILVCPISPGIAGGTEESSGLPEKCGFPDVVRAAQEAGAGPLRRDGMPSTLFQRTERQKTVVAGHFSVHYDTAGMDAAAMLDGQHLPIPGTANEFADSVASIANAVWSSIIDSLGYTDPPADGQEGGDSRYDVYVTDLDRTYGTTFQETPIDMGSDGLRYTSYIEIDNDFVFVNPSDNRGLPALRVTLAHEFFHAVQLGGYGLWSGHVYFYEIASVWMEDLLYTDVNDYYQYLFSTESQFAKPERSLTESGLIMYSRGILGHFITKRYGLGMMRRLWELSYQREVPPLDGLDIALGEYTPPTDFNTAFAEWTVWNEFTSDNYDSLYYPEGASYPSMVRTNIAVPDTVPGDLPPLASSYLQVSGGTQPLTMISANIDVEKAILVDTTGLPFSYIVRTDQPDPGYDPTLAGIYVKKETDDPFSLVTWAVVNGVVSFVGDSLPPVAASAPFPNPFRANGNSVISIPLAVPLSTEVHLYVYAADMDLVYSASLFPRNQRGKSVIQWNGRHDGGDLVHSGIYFYYADVQGKSVKGKFALIRDGG